MITHEDVLEKLNEWYKDDEGGFEEEWFETDLGSYELASLLDELEVDYPNERLLWYNQINLSIDDLVDVANVDFLVYTCERCGKEGYIGFPKEWNKFQGVLQGDDFGPIVINEQERTVCDSCYAELTCW